MKKFFALLGHNIQNSASPFVHNEIFKHFTNKHSNCFFGYNLLDIVPNNFDKIIPKLKKFEGLNVTSPYKIQIMKYITKKSKIATNFGCINTLKKLENNEFKGFCTDVFGFKQSLNKFKQNYFNQVLILGFGGAGQMIAKLMKTYCKNLFIMIRPTKQIAQINKNLMCFNKNNPKIKFVTLDELVATNFDLIINATNSHCSNKLKNNEINLSLFSNIKNFFDLNYWPTETALQKQAKKLGAYTINGVDMLVWQALEAQKIWNNFNYSNDLAKSIIEKTKQFLERKQSNT